MYEGLMAVHTAESLHACRQKVEFPRAEHRARIERELALMKQENGGGRGFGAFFQRLAFRSRPATPATSAQAGAA